MENTNLLPFTIAGKIEEKCYPTLQELFEVFAANLQIPIDTITVIQGAQGPPGEKGGKGLKGDTGPAGKSFVNVFDQHNIPTDVKFIDIPTFAEWGTASFKITVNRYIGGDDPFDPAITGVVGVGSIIQVFGEPVSTLRVFFTFAGGITQTPTTDYVLVVSYVK